MGELIIAPDLPRRRRWAELISSGVGMLAAIRLGTALGQGQAKSREIDSAGLDLVDLYPLSSPHATTNSRVYNSFMAVTRAESYQIDR